MSENNTSTFFIAKCGDKLLFEWVEPKFTCFVWYDIPTKFSTKEKCLAAIGSAMRNSEKPKAPIIIRELRETVIMEVVNEETL